MNNDAKSDDARVPFWQRLEFAGPLAATLIAAIVSVTTVVVQHMGKERELEVARIQQQAKINQEYLARTIEVYDDSLKREFALDFYSQVAQDPAVRTWAIGHLNVLRTEREAKEAEQYQQALLQTYHEAGGEERANLEHKLERAKQEAISRETRARSAQRIAALNNLIAPDHQTRWQAAESLSSVYGRDPGLPADLLQFLQAHSDDSLAIYNVIVVLEDLVKCCRTELQRDLPTVREILSIAVDQGGAQASAKAQSLDEQLGA